MNNAVRYSLAVPRCNKQSSFQSCSHCISEVYKWMISNIHTLYVERDIMHTYIKKRICKYFKTLFRSFQDAMSAIHKYAYILVFTWNYINREQHRNINVYMCIHKYNLHVLTGWFFYLFFCFFSFLQIWNDNHKWKFMAVQ